MIRTLILSCLTFFPSISEAEKINVRSGEHADFTRVVVDFKKQTDWTFGRVEGGYELRALSPDLNFDLSQVFKLIPRTRIETIESNHPGRLFFRVSCKCSGDAFELREGRIVLDIKSAEPVPGSPFEVLLPELEGTKTTGATDPDSNPLKLVQSTETSLSPHRTIEGIGKISTTLIEPGIKKPSAGSIAVAIIRSAQEIATFSGRYRIKIANHLDQISSTASVPSGVFSVDDRTQSSSSSADIADHRKIDPSEKHVTFPDGAISQPLGTHQNAGTNVAQQALLKQLQRAAAQGLIVVDSGITEGLGSIPRNSDPTKSEKNTATKQIEPDGDPTHLKIKTVVDDTPFQTSDLDTEGKKCLADELLAVGDWGSESDVNAPFDDLRSHLVGEFDETDTPSLIALARRNIFLGFGAEAIALIKAFDREFRGKEILLELANIVDGKSPAPPSILRSQLNCPTTSAIWAVLATQQIPPGEKLDTNAIILTFSGLPIHLREHLGPSLMQRFLDIEDSSTATSIGKLVERGTTTENQDTKLITAKLAIMDSKKDESILILSSIVKHGGPTAPEALVELINAQIQSGYAVSENNTSAADALAVEYRGTEIGHKLTIAVVDGLVLSGKIQQAFEKIKVALATKDIEIDEAEFLRASAHLQNAQKSSNEQFLILVFHQKFSDHDVSEISDQARLTVAERLFSLGFSSAAKQTLPQSFPPESKAQKILLAKIALVEKKPNVAKSFLVGVNDNKAKILLAQISEMKHEYAVSAEYYRETAMPEAQISAAWRDGDWRQVARLENTTKAKAARIALQALRPPIKIEIQNQPSDGTDPISTSASKRVQGRNLLTQSKNVRRVFSSLLFE